jgi:hypothetical protein
MNVSRASESGLMVAASSKDRLLSLAMEEAATIPRSSNDLAFRIPTHWTSPIDQNPQSLAMEGAILDWFRDIGCSDDEVRHVGKFDSAGFVGMPFPDMSAQTTLLTGKFLSLWVLWDDVQVEPMKSQWRLTANEVLGVDARPQGLSRFELGWWQILSELAARRSAPWIRVFCREMKHWSDAAAEEARIRKERTDQALSFSFKDHVNTRISTIGLDQTLYLLEDSYGHEFTGDFHQLPLVRQLKWLASLLVSIGNDVFSLGKDIHERQINLVTTLMDDEGIHLDLAVKKILSLHDAAIVIYDHLAAQLLNEHPTDRARIETWLQDIRYACIGFTRWESKARRYTAYKTIIDDHVIEPYLDLHHNPVINKEHFAFLESYLSNLEQPSANHSLE